MHRTSRRGLPAELVAQATPSTDGIHPVWHWHCTLPAPRGAIRSWVAPPGSHPDPAVMPLTIE